MKVYIVIQGYDYEGYNEPEAVFDTRDKAEKFIKETHPKVKPHKSNPNYFEGVSDYVSIYEKEVH